MKVVHIISNLEVGGAEMMLYKLLGRHVSDETAVVSLTEVGTVGQRMRDELGIEVHSLGLTGSLSLVAGFMNLTRLLQRTRPELVQTWMYHADLLGGFAALGAGRIPVIWNVRSSDLQSVRIKRATALTIRACAILSRWLPERIICCAEEARRVHVRLGYSSEKIVTIPNGFDVDELRFSDSKRRLIRTEIGIDDEVPLIGLVARFDNLKGQRHFVDAAGLLVASGDNAHFLMCGRDITWENCELVKWIELAGIVDRMHLLGERIDIAAVNSAIDVATCSSITEGFPNVVAEAMSCSRPCVVTDVGDAARIVGDAGVVVPPRDPMALSLGWRKVLEMPIEKRAALGVEARKRICKEYALDVVARQYRDLYDSIASETN